MPTMQAMPSRTNYLQFSGAVGAAGSPAVISFDITALKDEIRRSTGFWDRVDIEVQGLDAGITDVSTPTPVLDAQGVPTSFTLAVTATNPTDRVYVLFRHDHTVVA